MKPEEIREIRDKLRWTQQVMADEMGVSRNTVTRWESGNREPSGMALQFLKHLEKCTKLGEQKAA